MYVFCTRFWTLVPFSAVSLSWDSVGVDVLTPLVSFGYSLRMDSCAVSAKSELPAAHGTTSGGSWSADELHGLVRRVWWDRVLGIGADIRAI